MITERAFVPKQELVDEFRGLDMRVLTSLQHNAQRTTTINTRNYELEWDLLLPRILIRPYRLGGQREVSAGVPSEVHR